MGKVRKFYCDVDNVVSDEDIIVALNSEVEMLRSTISKLKKIHGVKYEHYCHEWDGMKIDEYDPEFSACICFKEDF